MNNLFQGLITKNQEAAENNIKKLNNQFSHLQNSTSQEITKLQSQLNQTQNTLTASTSALEEDVHRIEVRLDSRGSSVQVIQSDDSKAAPSNTSGQPILNELQARILYLEKK
jgi:hypothetical protein